MKEEVAMKNLFLPEVDLSESPDFNMSIASHWTLRNENTEPYRYIPNAFSKSECLEIIKLGRVFQIKESNTHGQMGFSKIRKSKNSWIPPCELTNWIFIRIQQTIEEVNRHYEYDLRTIENLQFTEYDVEYSGHYGMHVDKFDNPPGAPGTHRKLSFSIQLSADDSYEGGDLLLYGSGETPIQAIRQQGSINFFPSFVLHQVTPVTKGVRYSLVSWISGPKFK